MNTQNPPKPPNLVIVGAGPVGLWVGIQVKKHQPDWRVVIYERHQTYARSHILRVEGVSFQLYAKQDRSAAELDFFEKICGEKTWFGQATTLAVNAYNIGTNELEESLLTYAKLLGIEIVNELIEEPGVLEARHPECGLFVAADGAHSRMRQSLMGADSEALNTNLLQYCVEVKYKVEGNPKSLDLLSDFRKFNAKSANLTTEFIGKKRNGLTPITLRLFVDAATYDALPECSFKEPLKLGQLRGPLVEDVRNYVSLRKRKGGDGKIATFGVSKLKLSIYSAKRFATEHNGRSWFLAGDAAMGLPYFRSLNSGLIVGSQLGNILTASMLSGKAKILAYEAAKPLDQAFEFIAAQGKNLAVKALDWMRKIRW